MPESCLPRHDPASDSVREQRQNHRARCGDFGDPEPRYALDLTVVRRDSLPPLARLEVKAVRAPSLMI